MTLSLEDEGRGKAIERGVGDWRGGRDHDYEKAVKGEVRIKRTDKIGMIGRAGHFLVISFRGAARRRARFEPERANLMRRSCVNIEKPAKKFRTGAE